MNVRVYDSDIGRFLSADSIIQDPHDSQAYNRYSYVRNNPLKYTDPSGHSWFSSLWKKIKNVVIAVVVAVLAVYTGGLALAAMGTTLATASAGALMISGAAAGFTAGFAGGLLNGASIGDSLRMGVKGAIFGAISAGIANGIGTLGETIASSWGVPIARVGKALLHGIARAAISKAQGGKWSAGFWSGFAGSALAPLTEKSIAAAAIVGGTASELGGGKFANGAVSAAFVHMYNEGAHEELIKADNATVESLEFLSSETSKVASMNQSQFENYFDVSYETKGDFSNAKFKLVTDLTSMTLQHTSVVAGNNLIMGIKTIYDIATFGLMNHDSTTRYMVYYNYGSNNLRARELIRIEKHNHWF